MVSRAISILLILLLAACAPRKEIVLRADAGNIGNVMSIFVSTTRRPDEDGRLGKGRTGASRFYKYDISVPPDRVDGTIKTSKYRADPEIDFVATSAVQIANKPSFQADLTRALNQRPADKRYAVIYVHGFNNTFDESILRLAQMTRDFNFKGVPISYSWPSAGHVLDYEYDRDSVLFARDGLEELIRTVRRAGARDVMVFAHSMGTQLAMETLRQIAIAEPGAAAKLVDSVVLVSPDIDISVFKSQARRVGNLPDPFYIFISHEDRLLQLSSLVSGEKSRVGNIQNVDDLKEFNVQIIDVTEFSTGLGHNAPSDSPILIRLLNNTDAIANLFKNSNTGLASAVVLAVGGATETVLSPLTGEDQ